MHLDNTPYFPENISKYAPWVATHGLLQPYGKCQCGCGEDSPIAPTGRLAKGWRRDEPTRFVVNHGNNLWKATIIVRFWERVDKRGPDECWEWQGARTSRGYGHLRVNGRMVGAHRLAYELQNGPLAEGMEACHECDNPPCCNPSHLFSGTNGDNLADMRAKGRDTRGEKCHTARLNEGDVHEIRRRSLLGATANSLAEEYGVNPSTISSVINHESWKHV